jgi:peptidoglycan/xylan/chitin deacetylase (PgdA/CDA1 family)
MESLDARSKAGSSAAAANGTANYASHLSADRLAIYLFHGVVDGGSWKVRNYNRKHLEADYFRRLIQGLLVKGRPLSMDDVIRHHDEKRPYPANAFAITFDDGFRNNLSVAAPILSELGVPATYYVTSGFVDENGMSWIDRIEECIESAWPDRIRLPWKPDEDRISAPADGIRVLDEVRKKVKSDPTVDVEGLIRDIAHQCGREAPLSSDSVLDRKLTWSEVRRLADRPGSIVAGHSHRHGILAFLSQEELDAEIDTSLRLMREKAGLNPRHYSYPEGLAHCFDERVIRALKDRGIVCCPTAMPGSNAPQDDLFRLRRILVT